MVEVIEQTIEGKKLEQNQKRAILTSGENICVNAGAGSGKTFTILAKIIYILDQKLAKPEEIIVVAFNNTVANELRERTKKLAKVFPEIEDELSRISISKNSTCPECKQKVDKMLHYCESKKAFIERRIHTFHSYCYDRLKKNQAVDLEKYLQEDERRLRELREKKYFSKIIHEIGLKDKAFNNKLNTFFLSYLTRYKNIFKEIKNMKDYIYWMRPTHVGLKVVEDEDGKYPLKVRSIEELEIANFLYLKGIKYNYEETYKGDLPEEWKDDQSAKEYKPDFHLYKKDDKGQLEYDIYYEHFALDKDYNPPDYFDKKEKYKKDYQIKKNFLKNKLICTYSYQKLEGTLFDNLTKQLKDKGIEVPEKNIISDEDALEEFIEAGYFDSFSSLLKSFLTNYKVRETKMKDLKNKIKANIIKKWFETYEKKRERAFVEIFEKFYNEYQSKLEKENRVDFEDMLIKGKEYIENQNIKFLIVDEFQDISPLRAKVLQKIRQKNNGVKLFCVGDDWQSIYRFAGGDIKIFVNEDQHNLFLGKRKMVDLDITYRFNNRLAELTSNFILQNKEGQLYKKIKGISNFDDIPLIMFQQDSTDGKSFKINFSVKIHLIQLLDSIFKKEGNQLKKNSILFLARYRDRTYANGYEDLDRYLKSIFKSKKDTFSFSTIHSAKGSEAEYIFLMNVNDGYLAFPSLIEDDPILKLIVEHKDVYEYEEERRLFYVALTRTKKQVFLYGAAGSYFTEQVKEDKKNKEGFHYENNDIPETDEPNRVLVISKIEGDKKKKRANTPAKNAGIDKEDEIIQINKKKNPKKNDLKYALKDSEGDEIIFHIKNKNGTTVKQVKPFNSNENKNKKPFYSIGIPGYYEKEIHPVIEKLTRDYSISNKQ